MAHSDHRALPAQQGHQRFGPTGTQMTQGDMYMRQMIHTLSMVETRGPRAEIQSGGSE